MFFVLRIAICVVVVIISALIYRFFSKTFNKRFLLILLVISLTLFSLCGILPIENAFMTFDSPEEICTYRYGVPPICSVEGENSALFFYSQKQSFYHSGVIKENGGWKMIMGRSVNQKNQIVCGDIYLSVYQIKGADDVYIMVRKPVDNISFDLSDNRGTVFAHFFPYKNREAWCAYLENPDATYYVTINGENVYPFSN